MTGSVITYTRAMRASMPRPHALAAGYHRAGVPDVMMSVVLIGCPANLAVPISSDPTSSTLAPWPGVMTCLAIRRDTVSSDSSNLSSFDGASTITLQPVLKALQHLFGPGMR